MYHVIGTPLSRALRVMWLLEELGQPWRVTPAMPRSPEARAFDPAGKVPILETAEGALLTESVAIMTYLADHHRGCTHPPGTLERARQDAFTQFCVDCVEGALWTAAKHSFVLPEEHRVPAVKETARYEFEKAMAALADRLDGREFAAGAEFTVPDVLFGHAARWARAAKFPLPGGPAGAYLERVASRPALARALEKAEAAA